MPAALWPRSGDRQTTISNRVIAGARAYFFESGTTTPLTVYQDDARTLPHDHPVVADGHGEWPPVYFAPGLYRIRVNDDEGATLLDFDGVVAPGEPGEGALEVSDFAQTLLGDPDALTFLDTLGFSGYVVSLIGTADAAAFRTAFDVAQAGIASINAQSGTSYTLALSDRGGTVEMNNGSANVLTIPLHASVAFPAGTFINVVRLGVGVTTIDAAPGVTLNGVSGGSCTITTQYGGVSLRKRADNNWGIVGLHTIVAS